jgi:hypothetical protein
MEYSRYKAGEDDGRAAAKSMVEKHAEAQKNAMQEACLGALRRAMPAASAETCLAALRGTDWDADKAYHQLKSFMSTESGAGGGGAGGGGGKRKKARRDRGGSSSDSDDSDSDADASGSSSSSSSSRSRKKSKKHKKRGKSGKKEKESKKKKKSSKKERKKKASKEKRRERDDGDGHGDGDGDGDGDGEAKKAKKAARGAGAAAGPETTFGARGFLKETDKYDKEAEFRAWVEEVKKLSTESLQKWEERELFKEFAEDYNTSTLPHEKFYDIDKWGREEAIRRAARGGEDAEERTAFDDEKERKREIELERARRTAEYKREAYDKMKSSGDLENFREQERLKELRTHAYNTGDVETLAMVNKKLAPEEKK